MLGAGREDTHFSFSFLLSCSYKHSGLIANVTCHIKDNVVAVFTSILRLPKLTNENQKPEFFFFYLFCLYLEKNCTLLMIIDKSFVFFLPAFSINYTANTYSGKTVEVQ